MALTTHQTARTDLGAVRLHRTRGILLSVIVSGILLLAGLSVYLLTFRLPAPTGPYRVGTTLLDLTDASRHDPFSPDPAARRELVVQLWYPAEDSSHPFAPYMRWREARLASIYAPLLRTHARFQAPVARAGPAFPVLLLNHRWGGQRTQNTVLAEELASRGYVVASIDHPHNAARTEFADGTVVRGSEDLRGPRGDQATAGEQIAFWSDTLQLWAADERFVLDQLTVKDRSAADPFFNRLDTAHAGALGHSFGGAAALALCGLDPRIQAAINLDGWTFAGLNHRTAAQAVLLFYEGSSQHREKQLATLPSPGSVEDQLDRADFAATEASLRKDSGYRLFLAGTQHMDFSDEPLLPPLHRRGSTGPTAPGTVNTILRTTVVQFFDAALRGQPAPILTPGQTAFPELTVERWFAGAPAVNRK